MNKFKLAFVVVLVLVTAFAFYSCKKEPSNWAAKVGDDYITFDDLDSQIKFQAKMSMMPKEEIDKVLADAKIKQTMLEQLIHVKAVYKKAMEDKSWNKDELNQVIELSRMQVINQYYLLEKLKSEIVISDKEVEDYYKKNPNIPKGVTLQQASPRLKAELFMQKFRPKSGEYVMNLVADSNVNREGFRKYAVDKEKKEKEAENKGAQQEQKK